MNSSQLFTVFGGTGFLGSRIVRRLCADGHRVRIAARHPERRADLLKSTLAAPVKADLFDPPAVAAALEGADGAVNAASLYLETRGLTFDAFHVEAAGRLAQLAQEAGVPRFVHISGIGSRPEAEDRYIRARGEGEAAVREAFPDAAIVRPSVMVGPEAAILGTILMAVRRLPVYPLFGKGLTRLQPVHADDVASAVAAILRMDEAAPCYELGGPDILTFREMVETAARAAGLKVRCLPVPFALWKALAFVAERLPSAPLTRHQIALLEEDNVASAALPGMQALGLSPIPFDDAVRQRLEAGG